MSVNSVGTPSAASTVAKPGINTPIPLPSSVLAASLNRVRYGPEQKAIRADNALQRPVGDPNQEWGVQQCGEVRRAAKGAGIR